MADLSPELFAQRYLTEVASHRARVNTATILELPGANVPTVDATDPTKRVFANVSAVTAATDRTYVYPNTAGQLLVAQVARVDAAANLVDDTSTQALFATANDALTVLAGQQYGFSATIYLTKGTNAVSTSFLFGGTATFTTCTYIALGTTGTSGTGAAANSQDGVAATATIVAASGAGPNVRVQIEGEFEINATGTIIPSIAFSGATGSTPVSKVGTRFLCWAEGANPITGIGAWA